MKTYTTAELNDILNKHKLWLEYDPSGVRANLSGADLSGAKNLNCPIACPEEGSFIAFKKAYNVIHNGGCIIKLEIPTML